MSTRRRLADKHYTYADYRMFPDGERWEIIHGIAYNMAPAPTTPHQSSVVELVLQVGNQLRGKPCKVFIAPTDLRFARDERTDKVVQPDLFVVCERSKITPQGVVGAPDWIVEVLSPASASHDQITKKALYEAEGVREYWLVHPSDHILTVYRQTGDGSFGAAEIREMKGRVQVAAVPGLEIDWDLWEPLFPPDAA